jgi:hypothetical protein
MGFQSWLTLFNEVQQIGYDGIQQRQLFGPVYHGTTAENIDSILQNGFRIHVGGARTGNTLHGFEIGDWGGGGIPPPVHFLGYGIYFTQAKSVAKQFGKVSNQFYLDVPRLEVMNFAAPHKMMKWWQQHGYDMQPIENANDYSGAQIHPGLYIPPRKSVEEQQAVERKRIEATKRMTEVLKSKYDAVLFTGKSMRGSLLDGNQICVYDPQRIYLFNAALNPADHYFPGDRAKVKNFPISIKIRSLRESGPYKSPWDYLLGKSDHHLMVELRPNDAAKLKEYYHPQLVKVMLTNPELRQEIEERHTRSQYPDLEEDVRQYADYLTSMSNLRLNFPESLLEKKLAKGARA